ncbi:hypothetical protein FHG87_003901 [Trinorchestia longiramus]|nr:hypothetical protein FHG87_003901 [Trinorchestia longiramus]
MDSPMNVLLGQKASGGEELSPAGSQSLHSEVRTNENTRDMMTEIIFSSTNSRSNKSHSNRCNNRSSSSKNRSNSSNISRNSNMSCIIRDTVNAVTPLTPVTQLPCLLVTPIIPSPSYPLSSYPTSQLPYLPVTLPPSYPTSQLPHLPVTPPPSYPSYPRSASSNATHTRNNHVSCPLQATRHSAEE